MTTPQRFERTGEIGDREYLASQALIGILTCFKEYGNCNSMKDRVAEAFKCADEILARRPQVSEQNAGEVAKVEPSVKYSVVEEILRKSKELTDHLKSKLAAEVEKRESIEEDFLKVSMMLAASGWRPAKSAPKDGTQIVALCGEREEPWIPQLLRWNGEHWEDERGVYWFGLTYYCILPLPKVEEKESTPSRSACMAPFAEQSGFHAPSAKTEGVALNAKNKGETGCAAPISAAERLVESIEKISQSYHWADITTMAVDLVRESLPSIIAEAERAGWEKLCVTILEKTDDPCRQRWIQKLREQGPPSQGKGKE